MPIRRFTGRNSRAMNAREQRRLYDSAQKFDATLDNQRSVDAGVKQAEFAGDSVDPPTSEGWHRHTYEFVSMFADPPERPFRFCDICQRWPEDLLGRGVTQADFSERLPEPEESATDSSD